MPKLRMGRRIGYGGEGDRTSWCSRDRCSPKSSISSTIGWGRCNKRMGERAVASAIGQVNSINHQDKSRHIASGRQIVRCCTRDFAPRARSAVRRWPARVCRIWQGRGIFGPPLVGVLSACSGVSVAAFAVAVPMAAATPNAALRGVDTSGRDAWENRLAVPLTAAAERQGVR